EDAFKTQILTALRPTVLCVPANVDNQQPGDQTRPNFLMCYRAKPAPGSPKFQRIPVNVTDQFGSEALTLLKSAEICVPSFKVPKGDMRERPCEGCWEPKQSPPGDAPKAGTAVRLG